MRESALPRVPRAAWSAWLPVVVWAVGIFALSSVPHLGTDLGVWDLVLRKLGHAAEYAVLAILLLRALGSRLVSAFASVAYAVGDEWHQTFVPGREGSGWDVLVDAAGVAVGLLLWAHAVASRADR